MIRKSYLQKAYIKLDLLVLCTVFFLKKNLLIRLQCTFPFLHVSLKSKSIVILMFESLFLLGRGTKLTEVSVSDKLEGFRAAKEV